MHDLQDRHSRGAALQCLGGGKPHHISECSGELFEEPIFHDSGMPYIVQYTIAIVGHVHGIPVRGLVRRYTYPYVVITTTPITNTTAAFATANAIIVTITRNSAHL